MIRFERLFELKWNEGSDVEEILKCKNSGTIIIVNSKFVKNPFMNDSWRHKFND